MTLDRTMLCHRVETGEVLDFLFFWGHRPSADGSITASCLSQWFHAPFEIAGQGYPTAEHYMMAEKARLFADPIALQKILAAPDPATAKKLGRTVANFDTTAWNARRLDAVIEGNVAKFTDNPLMGEFLLSTGDRILVEASPRDTIWGIGLGARNERALDPRTWRGSNLLGFALMETRERIRIRPQGGTR